MSDDLEVGKCKFILLFFATLKKTVWILLCTSHTLFYFFDQNCVVVATWGFWNMDGFIKVRLCQRDLRQIGNKEDLSKKEIEKC